MCVTMYIPPNKGITKETLLKCFNRNPDSAGFMYALSGNLVIKRFLAFEDFFTAFVKAKTSNPKMPFVVHFRIKTSGLKNIANCHPFKVNKGIGMTHNGILTQFKGTATESDTNQFCRWLSPLLSMPQNWKTTPFWEMLEDFIGSGNKMIFMRNDGQVRIVKEKSGKWIDGIWYSNDYWNTTYTTTYTPQTPYKPYKAAYWSAEKNRYIYPADADYEEPGLSVPPDARPKCRICWYFPTLKSPLDSDSICKNCTNTPKALTYRTNKLAEKTAKKPPKYYIRLHPTDVEIFKAMIFEEKGLKILVYAGEDYIVQTRETQELADINDIDRWLESKRTTIIRGENLTHNGIIAL